MKIEWTKTGCLRLNKFPAVPVQTWTGPEDPRMMRLPDFMTIGT
jgi:hypothetical protein